MYSLLQAASKCCAVLEHSMCDWLESHEDCTAAVAAAAAAAIVVATTAANASAVAAAQLLFQAGTGRWVCPVTAGQDWFAFHGHVAVLNVAWHERG